MDILIVGSKGQLGAELLNILERGYSEMGGIPQCYGGASVTAIDYQELDISDESMVQNYFSENSFDLVINCAAMTDVDACETNKEAAFSVNALGSKNLAVATRVAGSKFLHVSTDYVFDGTENTPRKEEDPCFPKTVYGQTKLAGEGFVLKENAHSFVVRTAWLYGGAENNFANTIVRLARKNGLIKVVDDQIGSPTYVNDLADVLLRLAATKNYGVYHATNEGRASWFEFASAIVDEMGIPCIKIPCLSKDFPRPAKRPAFSVLDCTKLSRTINKNMRPWRDALASYVNKRERNQES